MKVIRKITEIYLLIYLIFISGSYYQLASPDIIKAACIIFAVLAAMWAVYILVEKKSVALPRYKNIYILFLLSFTTSLVHSVDISNSAIELYLTIVNIFIFIGILSLVSYGWKKTSLLNSVLVVAGLYNAYKIIEIVKAWPVIIDVCNRRIHINGPNKTAVMVNIIIILAVGIITQERKNIYAWALIFTGGFILIATGSRGGIIAAPAGIMAVVIVDNLRSNKGIKAARLIITGTAALAVAVTLSYVLRPFNIMCISVWTTSIGVHNNLWEQAIVLFKQRPLLGIGPNSFMIETAFIHPHNIYLKILSERGIFGLITSALLILGITTDLFINGEDTGLSAAAIGGLVTVMIHGLVDHSLSEPYITRYLIIIVALALARREPNKK